MKKVLYLSTCAIIFFTVYSCTSPKSNCTQLKKNADGNTIVRLQQQWFANSGFAGELVAKDETAAANHLQIEVIPGSDQIDTKQIVKSDQAEFGVAGAEQVLQANEKGANLVIIGVINYKSLACFISKKDKNIINAKDLLNHKIGTMEGSPVDLIYQALKKKEHLDIKKDDEIPTGWVLTGFTQNQYDVYPAFINDEPITLRMQGIEVNAIIPSNYDVNFIGTVYFCKKDLIESCPEVVQNFINSVSEGWEKTIKDPKNAIKLLKAYDKNINESKEMQSLIAGMDYYKGEEGKMLYAKEETWNAMADLLKGINKLKTFDYKGSVENKFVSWYLSRVKTEKHESTNE